MRISETNGRTVLIVGPIAIPMSFFISLGVFVGVGFFLTCMLGDTMFGWNGLGLAIFGTFFLVVMGIFVLVMVVIGIRYLIGEFRDVNGWDR